MTGWFDMDALQIRSHELDTLEGEAYEHPRRIRHESYELTRTILRRVLDAKNANGALDQHIALPAGGNIGVYAGVAGIFIVDDRFVPLTRLWRTLSQSDTRASSATLAAASHSRHFSGSSSHKATIIFRAIGAWCSSSRSI